MDNPSSEIKLVEDAPTMLAYGRPSSQHAFDYLGGFMAAGSRAFISNVDTRLGMLDVGTVVFPVTMNDDEYENCYVCSPYTAYVSYAQEEVAKVGNKALAWFLRMLSRCSGVLFKGAEINKTVSVNNWMLSTNLYPAWDGKNIQAIRTFLCGKFPDHALMFRSLNGHTNGHLLKAFRRNGFLMVPSRQIYILDQGLSLFLERKDTKKDLKALQKTDYKIVPHEKISEADFERILSLYNCLYLEKYSQHNPHFTKSCIAHWHEHHVIQMIGLRNGDGVLDGIVGFIEVNGVLTTPLFGYDTGKSNKLGLYRLLTALGIQRSLEKGVILNLSAGASDFKRQRGAIPFIEYSAVFVGHLPLRKRLVWNLLNTLLTRVGIPVMRAYKL